MTEKVRKHFQEKKLTVAQHNMSLFSLPEVPLLGDDVVLEADVYHRLLRRAAEKAIPTKGPVEGLMRQIGVLLQGVITFSTKAWRPHNITELQLKFQVFTLLVRSSQKHYPVPTGKNTFVKFGIHFRKLSVDQRDLGGLLGHSSLPGYKPNHPVHQKKWLSEH